MRGYPTLGGTAQSGPEKTLVYLRTANGREPAREFIEALPLREQARVRALMQRRADVNDDNGEQFAHVRGPIWALKSKTCRILCFNDREQRLVLVDGGWINKKLPRALLEKAVHLAEEYRRGKIAMIDRRAQG